MFVWGGFSHLVLLKGVGFSRVSDEARIVSALRTSLPGDGLYSLPSIDIIGNPSAEDTALVPLLITTHGIVFRLLLRRKDAHGREQKG